MTTLRDLAARIAQVVDDRTARAELLTMVEDVGATMREAHAVACEEVARTYEQDEAAWNAVDYRAEGARACALAMRTGAAG